MRCLYISTSLLSIKSIKPLNGSSQQSLAFIRPPVWLRKGRSCALQLIYVIDNWTKEIDEGDRIDVAYFDFTKGFDTVPTRGLLAKIQSYGIHGNILKWLNSFLTQRRQ